jgi:hypothetical protein
MIPIEEGAKLMNYDKIFIEKLSGYRVWQIVFVLIKG